MKGRITKIDPLKESHNKNQAYHRVYFQVREVDEEKKLINKWYKTDLVTKFRNYKRWSPHLQIGAVFYGLKRKDDKTIDADSKFTYDGNIELKDKDKEEMREHVEQLSLL